MSEPRKRGRPRKVEGDMAVTNIKITKAVHAKIVILAGLWGCSISEALERMANQHESDIQYVMERREQLDNKKSRQN